MSHEQHQTPAAKPKKPRRSAEQIAHDTLKARHDRVDTELQEAVAKCEELSEKINKLATEKAALEHKLAAFAEPTGDAATASEAA